MRLIAALILTTATLAVSCNDEEAHSALDVSSDLDGSENHAGSGGSAGSNNLPPDTKSYALEFGPITVESGKENTQCVVKRLGNAGPIHIGSIKNDLGTASHHLIVYRVSDTEEKLEPFDCDPFTDTLDATKGSTLMISQKKEDLLQLPAGVGYTLDPNQMIRLEMHYINTTANPVELKGTSTFTELADADFKEEANFLFIGSPDIKIPAHSKQTLGPIFFQLPDEYADAKFFAMTGHEHKMGTNVTVNLSTSKEDPGTPLYDVPNWQWSEPATVQFQTPVTVPQGGGFTFTCEWNNTSDQQIKFGESANQEMCFFWAYYYPSKGNGSKVCFSSSQLAPVGKESLCCPGDALCSLLQ